MQDTDENNNNKDSESSKPQSEEPSNASGETPIETHGDSLIEPTAPGWKSKFNQVIRPFREKFKNQLGPGFQGRVKDYFKKNWNKEAILLTIQNFDVQVTLDKLSKLIQERGSAFYGTLITIVLSTYFLADVSALLVADYLPTPPPTRLNTMTGRGNAVKTQSDYQSIYSRNLFNSRGLIPGDEVTGKGSDMNGPPVKSGLPLNLIGTLVMSNELLSIATIEDKATSNVYPVQVDDEIPDKIKVLKVEARRVIFLNKSNSRREYIELPEDAIATNPKLTQIRPSSPSGGGIEKVAPTQFNVSRSEVDKALSDLNNILTQARAVPNFENGVASGYKLFQIVPGSIYDKLGLVNGDVIVGLNNSPVNDPGKAFEMLNELKTSNHLELQVKKDGKTSTYSYDIH